MDRHQLNREYNGLANSEKSCLSILLFIPSGPEDFLGGDSAVYLRLHEVLI